MKKEANDSDVLKHKNFNKKSTLEEKLEFFSQILAGKANHAVDIKVENEVIKEGWS